jgi:hypothetical protein
VIVTGYGGVFGTLLAKELAHDFDVIAATRSLLDLGDVDAVGKAARKAFALCCAAGPFQSFDRRIVRATVDAGAHWLDIADDARWFFDLLDDRELDALARERGVVVMPGLSSLPAVSGALVRRLVEDRQSCLSQSCLSGQAGSPVVHITLFIGNRNRKGPAAIASGSVLETPDRELLRRELGIDAVVRTKFEAPGASAMLRLLGKLPERARTRAAKIAAALAKPFRIGTSGGYVEARAGDRAERVAGRDQRLAILPLVYALKNIDALSPGVHSPSVLEAEELLHFVAS